MRIIYLALFTLVISGCKKGWLDVNYNPLELTDSVATPDLVLPPLLRSEIPRDITISPYLMGYWCNPMAAPGNSIQTYRFTPYDQIIGPVIGWSLLEDKARRTNQYFYQGITKIMQALTWSRIIDIHNNVPYFEAFKSTIRQPKYDSGQTIYEDLMQQLDSAIVLIKDAEVDKNPRISIADIMFRGDKSNWIKFVNSLKLRLLVHQANMPGRETYIQQEVNKITEEGSGFLLSGKDAAVNPGFNENNPNTFYQYYYREHPWTVEWYALSANVIALNFLKENQDPRLSFFYSQAQSVIPIGAEEPFPQAEPREFRGNIFGLPMDEVQYPYNGAGYVSQIGGIQENGPVTPFSTGIMKGYDMDMWVLTSIESMFLQAEAVQRGWLTGDAEQAYKEAVKESFRWLNVGGNSTLPELSDAVFENWYDEQVAANNPNVSWAAAPDKYKLLMFQKYMAFNGIEPFEAWVDYRRNGQYPNIPLSADPARISDKMPVRLLYPQNEYINNAENVKAQGEIDIFSSKIWWMP